MKEWFVIYTKPRCEKKIAQKLEALGIEVFCPLITTIKQWSDRKKKVEIPLFSSYIFLKIAEAKRKDVFQISGVLNYVYWLGKPATIKQEEIDSLKFYLSKPLTKVDVSSWQPGSIITIEKGMFRGNEAIVKRLNKNKVYLTITSLGVNVIFEFS